MVLKHKVFVNVWVGGKILGVELKASKRMLQERFYGLHGNLLARRKSRTRPYTVTTIYQPMYYVRGDLSRFLETSVMYSDFLDGHCV